MRHCSFIGWVTKGRGLIGSCCAMKYCFPLALCSLLSIKIICYLFEELKRSKKLCKQIETLFLAPACFSNVFTWFMLRKFNPALSRFSMLAWPSEIYDFNPVQVSHWTFVCLLAGAKLCSKFLFTLLRVKVQPNLVTQAQCWGTTLFQN